MINNNMLLYDFKERIKSKYGYDDDFAINLAIMAGSFIELYGSDYENLILSSIENCKFSTSRLKLDTGKRETLSEIFEREGISETVTNSRSSLFYSKSPNPIASFKSVPQIIFQDGNFLLNTAEGNNGVKRMVALGEHFNWDNPASLGALANAIERCINNTNAYTISGNIITIKDGLSERTEVLRATSKGVKRAFISEKGIGLEEGIISYNEQKLIRSSYNPKYDALGESDKRLIAGNFIDQEHFKLGDIIKIARITKDYGELETIFSQYDGGYIGLLHAVDEVEHLEQARLKLDVLSHPERLERINTKLSHQFCYIIAPKVRNMESAYTNTQEKRMEN